MPSITQHRYLVVFAMSRVFAKMGQRIVEDLARESTGAALTAPAITGA